MKRAIMCMFGLVVYLFAQSPFNTQIDFSGIKWGVFTNYDKFSKNYFSEKGVWVDSSGYLYLRAWRVKADTGFRYFSSGVISKEKHLYGVYRFKTHGRLDVFFNSCFAPFLYDWDSGRFEIDIEYSRWSKKSNNPASYTVHYMPHGKHFRKHFDFSLPDSAVDAFHYIYLFPDSIVFRTSVLEGKKERTCGYWVVKDKRFIPHRPVYIEIYLWWPYRVETGEDSSKIIVKSVEFEPLHIHQSDVEK